jgi:hypothetical protein
VREGERWMLEIAGLRCPDMRPGRLRVDSVFSLICATDAASLASEQFRQSSQVIVCERVSEGTHTHATVTHVHPACYTQAGEELPSHSAVVIRQMNADPAMVAEFLRRHNTAITHLMIGEPLPKSSESIYTYVRMLISSMYMYTHTTQDRPCDGVLVCVCVCVCVCICVRSCECVWRQEGCGRTADLSYVRQRV